MKKLMTMIGAMMLSVSLFANNEPAFGYQGVLRDEKGDPLKGVERVTIEFRLYNGTESTDAKWGRSIPVPIDTNGLFNAELADANGTPLLSTKLGDVLRQSEAENKPIYVGLMVEGSSGEIRPRQKLIPVPVAAYAQDVGVAKGDFTVAGQATFKSGIGIEKGSLVAPSIEITGETALGTNVVCGAISTGDATVSGDIGVTGKVTAKDGFYLSETVQATTPIGAIMMWSGSGDMLPPGWRLCEGQGQYYDPYAQKNRDIPDLRGRFIVGINSGYDGHSPLGSRDVHDPNETNGTERVVLTEREIASHTHGYITDDSMRSAVDGLLKSAVLTDWLGGGDQFVTRTNPPSGEESKTYLKWDFDHHDGKWDNLDDTSKRATRAYTGKNNLGEDHTSQAAQAHDNMPPYYALCYIIFIGNSEANTSK